MKKHFELLFQYLFGSSEPVKKTKANDKDADKCMNIDYLKKWTLTEIDMYFKDNREDGQWK